MRITRKQLRQLIREAIDGDDSRQRRGDLSKLVGISWSDPSYAAAVADVALGDPQLLLEFWSSWRWISDYLFWESLALGGAKASFQPISLPTDRTDRVKMMARWLGARPEKSKGWLLDFKTDVVKLANIRPNLEGIDDYNDDGDIEWSPPQENTLKEIEYISERDNFINKHADTFNNYVSSKRKDVKPRMRDINSSGLLDAVLNLKKSDNDIIEGKKASKSKGKPYKGSRRGKTESQAQQMAAGIALSAREKHGKAGAIKRLKGASKSMAAMSMKDLRKLATIRRGSEVPDSTKKGKERASLPGHIKKKK